MIQNFDFEVRAHFRARIMARAHDDNRMRYFISDISSLHGKSIGRIFFAVDGFFTKKTQTGWRGVCISVDVKSYTLSF